MNRSSVRDPSARSMGRPGLGRAGIVLSGVALLSLSGSAAAPVDLDVAVPPGSPLEWGRAFPSATPRGGALFPKTAGGKKADAPPVAPGRTSAPPRKAEMDVRITTSFGLVRILTWDLALHLDWIGERTPPLATVSGRSGLEPPPPVYSDALYWVCTAPLLRLMLHPFAVSSPELLAHLIEIGEPVLAVMDAARSEPSLRKATEVLREKIMARREAPVPFKGETPRETMLAHFVYEELLREHPYSPEGTFARRLFVLGDEVIPYLQRYCKAKDPTLARNATAALAKYSTEEAGATLLELAARTKDPVILMRALAAVSSRRFVLDHAPLVKRLLKAQDEIERVALVGALGQLQSDEAVPVLLAMMRRERKPDPDRLLSILTALAHYASPVQPDRVAEAVAKLRKRIGENPRGFRPDRPTSSHLGDIPDSQETRAHMLRQLASIILARFDPGNDRVVSDLVELSGPGQQLRPFQRGLFHTASLANVQPAVRYLYLDVMSELGEKGVAVLRAVALDGTGDPALRGFALGRLPYSERTELAEKLLVDEREGAELRAYAFEVMMQGGHPKGIEHATELVRAAAELPASGGSAAERFLYLGAMGALEDRGQLETDDLLALLPVIERAVHDRSSAVEEAHEKATDLVDLAATGRTKDVRVTVEGLVAYVLAQRLNEALSGLPPSQVVEHVERILAGVRPRRKDPAYLSSVVEAIMSYLMGTLQGAMQQQAEFEPTIPFEQEVVLALGRSRDGRAVEALVRLLRNPKHPLRATMALALGLAGHRHAVRHLIPLLVDPDTFTRYCAYESLRHLTGEDHFADWFYGETSEAMAAANLYGAWVSKNR